MIISNIIAGLESFAPPVYQESYDNAGLLTGEPGWHCSGIVVALDATEAVVLEAKARGANLIVAHHPIVFSGLKKINGKNYVEKAVIAAIKNDIAIYAIHTNLDNVMDGVNGRIADILGLLNRRVMAPRQNTLRKLYTFVPPAHLEQVRSALFAAGGGQIGQYSECSFQSEGEGSFRAGDHANPFVGEIGKRHLEPEVKLEMVFPAYLEPAMIAALKSSHPYEEVAYDLISLTNSFDMVGTGIIGELPEPVAETAFLERLKNVFRVPVIRHTPFTGKPVQRVAFCGGAGSFLVNNALQLKADIYITGDMKYHEFFDANDRLVIADVGHFESEQYTVDLLYDILAEKFPTFAVFKTGVRTNPVNYYI
ncbi:Nif3-like dinuclear metal center hexameric protein [Flavihumibacter stibioxidans]|uniref:GTP cyclohydrolase 1 type 2 homolog n=1 Tax=Flavihumibacter stibioxidans TaxID=1834163 RepID=A0ABR7M5V2_9BACT|nr:Nif3-like dinuclear metal center hexameric protein [Flavihumibacter stibioxidans]MBC6490301.1 Nif3-like dinuclear metal center hexameric protein [Flavihumibacter stibioxidans]